MVMKKKSVDSLQGEIQYIQVMDFANNFEKSVNNYIKSRLKIALPLIGGTILMGFSAYFLTILQLLLLEHL